MLPKDTSVCGVTIKGPLNISTEQYQLDSERKSDILFKTENLLVASFDDKYDLIDRFNVRIHKLIFFK